MGDFGIKAWLRLQLVMAGIDFNDLKPRPGGSGNENRIKAHAESLMFRRGISVEDLKVGTVYHDPNYVFVKDTEEVDIEKKKKKEDAAAFDNMTESAMKLNLQYATERLYRSSIIEEEEEDDDEEDDGTDPMYGLGIMDVAFAGMRRTAYQKDNKQLSY